MKSKLCVFLLLLLLQSSFSYGVIVYYDSIEWLVDSSKVVVLATGVRNAKHFFDNLVIQKTFKGTLDIQKVNRNSLFAFGDGYNDWSESDQYLMFFKQNDDGTVLFSKGFNLDKMSFPFHCLATMNMEILHEKKDIFELIEKRAKMNPTQTPYSRTETSTINMGYLILPISGFKNARNLESAQFLFVPADPIFKQTVLSNAMKIPFSDFWIYQLVNYPDSEVKAFLHRCLNDKTTSSYHFGPKQEKKTYFPISQAAYWVLTRLGEHVEKPEFYDENAVDCHRH